MDVLKKKTMKSRRNMALIYHETTDIDSHFDIPSRRFLHCNEILAIVGHLIPSTNEFGG